MAKRKLTIWVEDDLASRLEYMARAEGLAVSQYGAILLERAMREAADELGLDLVGKRIELALAREFDRSFDRIETLLFRTSIDSASARGLVFQILKTLLDEEEAAKINKSVGAYAVKRMKLPIEGFEEIKAAARKEVEERGNRQSQLQEGRE